MSRQINMSFSRSIEPLFLKNSDIKHCGEQNYLPILLCREVNKVISNDVIGVQISLKCGEYI